MTTIYNSALLPEPSSFLPNGVLSAHQSLPLGTTKFLCVARFDTQKDHQTFIQACSLVRTHSFHVTFFGNGPNFQQMRDLAAFYGLTNCFTFCGEVDQPQRFMRFFDVLVLSSHWEGLPISILEAMSQGLPVIASSVGGVSEAVSHQQTGLLVPPKDPVALSNAMTLLMQNQSLINTLGRNACQRFSQYFSEEILLDSLQNVYSA